MFPKRRGAPDDPPPTTLFDHLPRGVLVAEEHPAGIDSKRTVPLLYRVCENKREIERIEAGKRTIEHAGSRAYTCVGYHLSRE